MYERLAFAGRGAASMRHHGSSIRRLPIPGVISPRWPVRRACAVRESKGAALWLSMRGRGRVDVKTEVAGMRSPVP